MSRNVNEELFDRMMRLPHAMRTRMQGDFGPQTMPHHPGEGGRFETMPHHPGEGGRFETMPHRPGEGGRFETMPHHPGEGGHFETMPHHPGEGGRFDHPGEGPRFGAMPDERGDFETLPQRPEEGGRPEMMPFGPDMEEGRGPGPMPHHRGHGGHGERGGRGERRAPFARERALELLLDSEAGLRQKEIGEGLGINPSSTSEFVSRLEADGYVRREADPADGRATRIVLSEMGRARAAELRDARDARFDALFGNLTDDEKRQLIALLDKLFGREEKGNQMVRV